jgi:NAD(P)-dependent dehydrogenase (short-subunit alcohol dehydrogenase family)
MPFAHQREPESRGAAGHRDAQSLEAALATNLLGPFRLTKALLGALRASAVEARGGVVMNISSDAAVTPYPGWGAYGASKAALAHLSAIWNLELEGEGIRVLARDPGDMDTPLHALAVPGADRSTLLRPEAWAREITRAFLEAMPASAAAREEAA